MRLQLRYLPANAAWAYFYGDTLIALYGHSRFFPSQRDAKAAATGLGLSILGAK